MKYILFTILFFSTTLSIAQSSCDSTTTKIMMVGDSWSFFSYTFNSIPINLDRHGFPNVKMHSNVTDLSVNGAETHDFLTAQGKQAIKNGLDSFPDVEIVNLSIGGNDLLGTWNKSLDSLTTDSLILRTMQRTDSIIQYIKSLRPGIKIYIPGYDFANFEEVITSAAFPSIHPFYSNWNKMGKPNFVEINTLLAKASKNLKELTDTIQNTNYTNALGLMQYTYGQTTALAVSPGGTYPAKSVPVPGGNLNYPSPIPAMNDYFIFTDCFHLSRAGYNEFYNYHFKHYYWETLRGNVNKTIYSNGNMEDGTVSSLSTSDSAVKISSTSSSVSKGILSFNTSSIIPSKQIKRATIFIHRDSLSGSLPVFNQVLLEVKKGHFGSSVSLETADFNSSADKVDTACTYGTLKENGYWLRINVPLNLLSEVTNSPTTQFRISSLNTNSSALLFSTGDSVTKPFMDVEYRSFATIVEQTVENQLVLYPNPSQNNLIYLKNSGDFSGSITAVDITGRQLTLPFNSNQIDVSGLTQGTYFFIFRNKEQQFVKRFVKL